MKAPYPYLFALALTLPLVSCRIVGGVPDFSVMEDTFSPAQADSVYVESKPRTTRLAATPAPTAPETAPATPAPSTTTAAPAQIASTAGGSYTVKQGDTLSHIARAHGVTLSNLASANGMDLQNAVIKPGQQLRIPQAGSNAIASATPKVASTPATSSAKASTATPAPTPAKPKAATASRTKATQHTVAAGETLYRIALQHGISLNELLSANNLTEAQAPGIRTGTVLTIPTTAQR